jgi:hypothetical protein
MIGNALQDHEAVGDILCAGGVLVKRLGQISASSAASAVRKIVTGPFLQSSSAVGLLITNSGASLIWAGQSLRLTGASVGPYTRPSHRRRERFNADNF